MIRKQTTASRNMQDYRLRKRADGYCIYGGCWKKTGGPTMCPAHMEHKRIVSNERRVLISQSRDYHPCPTCGAATQNKYCSPGCQGASTRKWVLLMCAWCGQSFYRSQTRHDSNIHNKKSDRNFHSRQCAGKWIWFVARNREVSHEPS